VLRAGFVKNYWYQSSTCNYTELHEHRLWRELADGANRARRARIFAATYFQAVKCAHDCTAGVA